MRGNGNKSPGSKKNYIVYRPPGMKGSDFDVLNEIEKLFINSKKPEPTIILSWDFNFPFVIWKWLLSGGCTWSYKSKTNATYDEIIFTKLLTLKNGVCYK